MTYSELLKHSQLKNRALVIPIGGVGAFGMNLTCYICAGRLFIVDCGLAFAEDYQIGVDAHIPQIDELISAFGGVTAYFITHGHEDHLGALPYFLERWPAPTYATAWTSELLRAKLVKRQVSFEDLDIRLVRAGDKTKSNGCTVHWLSMPHSIPMNTSLILELGGHRFLHTGDFKTKHHPSFEKAADLATIEKFGNEGIDAVLGDSTNAHIAGFCPGEDEVNGPLSQQIASSQGLVIITTFASNLWRLKTVVEICKNLGKKIHFAGAGMLKTLQVATELGLHDFDSSHFIEAESIQSYPREEVVIVMTGSQAEPRSALRRLIAGELSYVALKAQDRIIFSSRIIPGNEKPVLRLMSECSRLGVEFITTRQDPFIHVSGHAYQEDLKAVYKAARPRHIMPVHGSFTQIEAHCSLSKSAKILRAENGSVFCFEDHEASKLTKLDLDVEYVDSWSRLTMSQKTMRERLKIGDSGLCLVSGLIDTHSDSHLTSHIEIQFTGIPSHPTGSWDRWKAEILDKLEKLIYKGVRNSLPIEEINQQIRLETRRRLTQILVKKPVVISEMQITPAIRN